jgi:diguanylate cyclase (GGDEF)-like protein
MKNKDTRRGFRPQENLISILPSVIAGIFVLLASTGMMFFYSPIENQFFKVIIILYGIFGSLYLASYYLLFSTALNKTRFTWINAIISGIALGGITMIATEEIDYLLYMLIILAAMNTSLVSTRGPSYMLVLTAVSIHLINDLRNELVGHQWIINLGLTIAAFMIIETIQQLKNIAREQINGLEIINEFSKQIATTLETGQVMALLNAAFQNAIKADTYYLGIVDKDEIRLELFYDDGEYFNNVHLKRKGTLANWVLTHQQELFLPDLRKNVQLDDVELVIIGKKKTSLSWLGVPVRGLYVDGVMAIASYSPNAFDRSTLELLSTIAQRAALALDNTYHHELVKEQARLDSLTRVYNHGHFIQALGEQAKACASQRQPLSLIMLDIDFFKQYNDKFGHLVGDEVLTALCDVVRSHIKNTDSIGRWGGEEFAISLPYTDGQKAMIVAGRIRETMASLKMKNEKYGELPVPTISMGIAVFPAETNEIMKLIDLADNRLYLAKERGRDQIEPAAAFWQNTKTE